MLQYPDIDPIAVALGPLKVHWYGVMYLCAFISAWVVAMHRAKSPTAIISREQVENMIT